MAFKLSLPGGLFPKKKKPDEKPTERPAPNFPVSPTGELLKTPEQTTAYNNPNKIPPPLPPGTPSYQDPNDKTASYRADFNPDKTVDYTIGGKTYHLTRAEYDMLSPSSAGIITPNVEEIQGLKKNLRLYGGAEAPEEATQEKLDQAVNKIPSADTATEQNLSENPIESFKQGFSDTFKPGNINANILSGFAQTIDMIKSIGTLKPSKTVTQAIDTFSSSKQSVSDQIAMVRNGELSYTDAAQSLRTMRDAIDQLESATKTNAQANLNYWLDQGLNLQTQIIYEKDDMDRLETELIMAYNNKNTNLEAGYSKQYGGY